MPRTRHGKIASLPHAIREEINLRLHDGEELRPIVQWLKTHEEVRTVLVQKFHHDPITIQNLSDWKLHGHREWLLHRETLEDARALKEQSGELLDVTGGGLADPMAEVLMARLLRAFRNWDGNLQSRSGRDLTLLRALCREAAELRRASHSAARLQLKREQLELLRRSQDQFMKAEFDKWLDTPEAATRALQLRQDEPSRQNQIRQLFGMEPTPPWTLTKLRELFGIKPAPGENPVPTPNSPATAPA